jgi:hypothetical protein
MRPARGVYLTIEIEIVVGIEIGIGVATFLTSDRDSHAPDTDFDGDCDPGDPVTFVGWASSAPRPYPFRPWIPSMVAMAAILAVTISDSVPHIHMRPKRPTEEMWINLMLARFSASLAAMLM